MSLSPFATKRSRGFRVVPKVEQLESRWVPTTSVSFGNGTLTIIGDNGPNAVVISDQGNGLTGSVTVIADGVTTSNPAPITNPLNVRVFTFGGNDAVLYNLNADLLSGQSRSLNVNLGKGTDFFQGQTTQASTELLTNSNLSFNVSGGQGNKTLYFNFTKQVLVDSGAVLNVTALGGPGKDKIVLQGSIVLNGTMTFNLNGNQGQDKVGADLRLASGTGTLIGSVNGGSSDDLLAFLVGRAAAFTGTATGTLNGGSGFDAGIASPFVQASQVENLLQLPF